MNLLDDQKKAVDKLKRLKVGALFMEPGTGKTLTAMSLVDSSDAELCIWLTPFQNKDNIVQELNKYGFAIRTEVVGIETLSSSDKEIVRLSKLIKNHRTFMVCDESLKIKNGKAKRTYHIAQLGKLADYRLILNGTPLSKNIMDLWSQFEFLSPKILKMTEQKFKDTFVHYVSLKNKYGRVEKYKDFVNLEYLHSIIDPFIFESKLNLSVGKEERLVHYKLDEYSKNDYEQAKQRFINSLFISSASFFAGITGMQMSYSSSFSKFEAVKSIVDEKTIIFCRYVKTAEELRERFKLATVLTYGKGSYGLNLQDKNKVIFFDKIFDYAQLEQAKRRVYRIGQKNKVTFYMLSGNVGLENMFDKCIEKKTDVLTYFKSIANDDHKEMERQMKLLL